MCRIIYLGYRCDICFGRGSYTHFFCQQPTYKRGDSELGYTFANACDAVHNNNNNNNNYSVAILAQADECVEVSPPTCTAIVKYGAVSKMPRSSPATDMTGAPTIFKYVLGRKLAQTDFGFQIEDFTNDTRRVSRSSSVVVSAKDVPEFVKDACPATNSSSCGVSSYCMPTAQRTARLCFPSASEMRALRISDSVPVATQRTALQAAATHTCPAAKRQRGRSTSVRNKVAHVKDEPPASPRVSSVATTVHYDDREHSTPPKTPPRARMRSSSPAARAATYDSVQSTYAPTAATVKQEPSSTIVAVKREPSPEQDVQTQSDRLTEDTLPQMTYDDEGFPMLPGVTPQKPAGPKRSACDESAIKPILRGVRRKRAIKADSKASAHTMACDEEEVFNIKTSGPTNEGNPRYEVVGTIGGKRRHIFTVTESQLGPRFVAVADGIIEQARLHKWSRSLMVTTKKAAVLARSEK